VITWTIGAGGLLGSAVEARSSDPFVSSPVSWADTDSAIAALLADLQRFREQAGTEPWAIVWAAGAATVSSTEAQTQPELDILSAMVEALGSTPQPGPGAFFLTSSAGGVYAGSTHPPFTATTTARALSAYGELKLEQERVATDALAGTCALLVGRIGNLYGPGQNLAKLQGLISRLALAAANRQPLNIFVPLDTLRDYVYVDDAAAAITLWIEGAVRSGSTSAETRIIASGESVTVGQLITTMRQVTKRRIPIALGSHASSRNQVLDLRLQPTVPLNEQGITITPLPVGTKRVSEDVLAQLRES
jgi:UDP-glucose 4-epimerase